MTLIRWKRMNDIASWTPMADLSTDLFPIEGQLGRILNRFFNYGITGENDLRTSTWCPSVDVAERDDAYVMTVDLPGVSKDDVKITLKDTHLTIRGEKKKETEETEKNYFRSERHYGTFQRTFTLPSNAREDTIEANFMNGVLTIEIPKAKDTKPQEIEVKVS